MVQTHADSTGSEPALARRLMRLADRGALATTLAPEGPEDARRAPYASFVLLASDLDGSPILTGFSVRVQELFEEPKWWRG